MLALCPVSPYESAIAITGLGVLIILSFPVAVLVVLWKIFVPPSDLPGANMLALDPENSGENRSRFCWSGIPIWKPLLYVVLTVLTLIY